MFENAIHFWSRHVIFSNFVHAAGGFGLAVVLQYHLRGEAFASPVVGWTMLILSLLAHGFAHVSRSNTARKSI